MTLTKNNKRLKKLIIPFALISLSGCQSLTVKDEQSSAIEERNFEHHPAKTIVINAGQDNEVVVQTLPPDDTSVTALEEVKLSPLDDPASDIWDLLPDFYHFSYLNNPAIEKEKQRYLKHPASFTQIGDKAKPFLYFILNEIRKRKLPGELALLPIVESAYDTYAYSSGRAAGLWQFIPSTGKAFGLNQNWWYDGRRDIYRSTHAALDYLEQLNKRFDGDWLLTLAAYNAGAGNVNKAIRKNAKAGKNTNYWSLKLPKETKLYVPRLIALAKLVRNKSQHQILLPKVANKPFLEYVDAKGQIDLAIAANIADISIEQMYQYNPAFNQWATHPNGPHHLLIPISSAVRFKQKLQNLNPEQRLSWNRYKIQAGDSLLRISNKFNVSVEQLKVANQLTSHRIRAGKYLLIPSASKDGEYYSQSIAKRRDKILKKIRSSNKKIHRVKAGESLWTIARKYRISYKSLAKRNRISTRKVLSIGQKLIVWSDLPKPKRVASNKQKSGNTSRNKLIKYRIKSGDSLYNIAKRFNVSINQIAQWNGLNKKKHLKVGKTLIVYRKI